MNTNDFVTGIHPRLHFWGQAGPATHHVFLSAFMFLPGTQPGSIRWTQAAGGVSLTLDDRRIVVLTQPAGPSQASSRGTWCCAADLQRRRAVACGAGSVEVEDTRLTWSQTSRFATW
jgi:hypothetical protein